MGGRTCGMFFPVSKILGFFANPSDLVVAIGVLGFALLAKRWTRAATWLIGACFLALVVLGLSPIGNMLMIPLEQRFPPWAAARGSPDGIVVLGGAIDGRCRSRPAFSQSANSLLGRQRGADWGRARGAVRVAPARDLRNCARAPCWRTARAIPSRTRSIPKKWHGRSPASAGCS